MAPAGPFRRLMTEYEVGVRELVAVRGYEELRANSYRKSSGEWETTVHFLTSFSRRVVTATLNVASRVRSLEDELGRLLGSTPPGPSFISDQMRLSGGDNPLWLGGGADDLDRALKSVGLMLTKAEENVSAVVDDWYLMLGDIPAMVDLLRQGFLLMKAGKEDDARARLTELRERGHGAYAAAAETLLGKLP